MSFKFDVSSRGPGPGIVGVSKRETGEGRGGEKSLCIRLTTGQPRSFGVLNSYFVTKIVHKNVISENKKLACEQSSWARPDKSSELDTAMGKCWIIALPTKRIKLLVLSIDSIG